MKNGNFSIAIFPFLKTSRPTKIGGYEFRCTTDLEGLPEAKSAVIKDLRSMLYLRDDFRIARAAYAIAEPMGAIRPGAVVERLERIRTVIGFLYSSPHPKFGNAMLPFDIASLAIIEPAMVSRFLVQPEFGVVPPIEASQKNSNKTASVAGYEGVFNFRSPLWLIPGSRIYGPTPNMFLNMPQDLAIQLGHEAVIPGTGTNLLFSLLDAAPSLIGERVFISLGWYNAANESDAEPARSLLNLAIAFETLLRLPRQEKTDRIVDAISLLLGRIDRLSDWAKQFYEARSQIVHEGQIEDWQFYIPAIQKNDALHVPGSIMIFGRQIFQLCLKTVLTGANLAEQAGLRERFIANSERYESIIAALVRQRPSNIDPLASIKALIDGLKHHQFVGGGDIKIEVILNAVKAAASAFLSYDLEVSPMLQAAIQNMVTARPKKLYEGMEAVFRLDKAFQDLENRASKQATILASLVDVAWLNLAPTYFYMQENPPSSEI